MSTLSRRQFLQISLGAGGAMWLGPAATLLAQPDADAAAGGVLNAFLRIERGGTVVIGARSPEIGQGVNTSLPMILAEELDVAWDSVRVEQLGFGYEEKDGAPGNRFGAQFAGGSTGIPNAWRELRQAGANARWLLLQAAGERWEIDPAQLGTRAGEVIHPDGRRLGYGELVARAAQLGLPEQPVALKTPDQYRILGRPTRVVDAEAIVRGEARYGIDQYADDAKVAMIERCPLLDGEVASFDASAALDIPGVRQVVAIPRPPLDQPFAGHLAAGVAVIADDTWSAIKGRRALRIEWTPGPRRDGMAALRQQARSKRAAPAEHAPRRDGELDTALRQAKVLVEADYETPFLAHATMEPQNCLLRIADGRAELIAPLQSPGGAMRILHTLTGFPRSNITIHLTRVGGGFGRRLENDFVAEAVQVLQAAKIPAVKLVWTREDDMRHDVYRPFGVHALRAGLDAEGRVLGWQHRVLATPRPYRSAGHVGAPDWMGTVDPDGLPAALVGAYSAEFSALDAAVPRGWWRAPVHTFVAFPIQCFIDELAAAAGKDPLAFRRELLGPAKEHPYNGHGGPVFDSGRLRTVLDRAAEAIGWGRTLPPGHGLGIACHFTFGGYTAHAMEVSVKSDRLRIERCVAAVDIGRVINPLGVDAQIMGGTLDGLSAAWGQQITVEDGRIQQGNFDDYPLLRMVDAPDVEVIQIASEREPAGAGEMGIPSAAPAFLNALFAATGKRIRQLPLLQQWKAVG